jgi:hypothetical protein
MKALRQQLLGLCLTCGLAGSAVPFERATHAAITYNAFQLSNLSYSGNVHLLPSLGLDVVTLLNPINPLDIDYFSIQHSSQMQIPAPSSGSLAACRNAPLVVARGHLNSSIGF